MTRARAARAVWNPVGPVDDHDGFRAITRLSGVDRKTVRRYVEAAEAAGLVRDGGEEQLTDLLVGEVCRRVRPDGWCQLP